MRVTRADRRRHVRGRLGIDENGILQRLAQAKVAMQATRMDIAVFMASVYHPFPGEAIEPLDARENLGEKRILAQIFLMLQTTVFTGGFLLSGGNLTCEFGLTTQPVPNSSPSARGGGCSPPKAFSPCRRRTEK